ncbi:MAG: hypothetical protein ACRC45_07620, partial [Cetobacterium sp.]
MKSGVTGAGGGPDLDIYSTPPTGYTLDNKRGHMTKINKSQGNYTIALPNSFLKSTDGVTGMECTDAKSLNHKHRFPGHS